jgi:hypothetical protein
MYLVVLYYRGMKVGGMRLVSTISEVFERLDELRRNTVYRKGSLEQFIKTYYGVKVYRFSDNKSDPKLIKRDELLREFRG